MNIYCIAFYRNKQNQWYEFLPQKKIKDYMNKNNLTHKNIMGVWLTKRIHVNDFLEKEYLKGDD